MTRRITPTDMLIAAAFVRSGSSARCRRPTVKMKRFYASMIPIYWRAGRKRA